jgi:hypothetical protein
LESKSGDKKAVDAKHPRENTLFRASRMNNTEIRFHKPNPNTPNDAPAIKSATIDKLIERITYEKMQDLTIVLMVLLCYRNYSDPINFFQLLEKRYSIDNPGLPPDQYTEWVKNVQTPVRLR